MAKEYIPKVWENYKTPILDEDLNHIENGLKEATDAINDEQTARTNADNAFQQSIDNEVKARTESDKTLQTNINNEAQAREQAVQGLQTNIDNETKARSQADNALQEKINTNKNDISELKGDLDKLKDDTIETVYGKNRCPLTLFDGYLESDGNLTIYSDWKTTDFIYVGDLENIISSVKDLTDGNRVDMIMYFLTTYDSNMNRLEQISNPSKTYTVEENVAYIRYSIHSDTFDMPMVESGSVKTEYEPYSKTYKAVNDDYALKVDVPSKETVKEIQNHLSVKELVPISVTMRSKKFIADDFKEYDIDNESFKVSNAIDVSEIKTIIISASTNFSNMFYVFKDDSNSVVGSLKSTKNAYDEIVDLVVTVPTNAKTLYVCAYGDTYGVKFYESVLVDVSEIINKINTKKWAEKKWVCLGDSLTEHNLRTTMNYHDYVAEETGITVVNMGHSGSGYKRSEDDGNAFYQRALNVPTDTDVVTIFGSGNDLLYIDSLGTYSDTGTDTIGGCINTTIDNIINANPKVSLGIVAPTPWVGNQPTLDDSNGMARYTELLRQICKVRSIPFLDLYHCSNLRPWTEEGRNACYTKDEGNGVHPDENGHKLIAPRFKAFLETLIM